MAATPQTNAVERRRGLIAVTVALAVVSLIHGLTLPMLGLVLEHQGVEKSLIGLNAAVQYLAVFAAAPFVSRLLRDAGPAVLMFWSVVVAAIVFCLLPIKVDVTVWFVLRFVLGTSQAFLWIAGEAWISNLADEHRRGRIVAVYGAVTAGGFALGPLVLSILGSDGWTPFLVAAAVTLSATIPLAVTLRGNTRLKGRTTGSFLHYAFRTPVATSVYFCFAACDAVLLTFLPIYAVHVGHSERIGVTLLTVMAVGAIISQYPIGQLADRINGMAMTMGAVIVGVIALLLTPFAVHHAVLGYALLFTLGCSFGAMYTLSLVLIGRRFKGAELGAAATVRSLVFCIGSSVGPPLVGWSMELFGAHALPLVMAMMFLLTIPIAAAGMGRKWIA